MTITSVPEIQPASRPEVDRDARSAMFADAGIVLDQIDDAILEIDIAADKIGDAVAELCDLDLPEGVEALTGDLYGLNLTENLERCVAQLRDALAELEDAP